MPWQDQCPQHLLYLVLLENTIWVGLSTLHRAEEEKEHDQPSIQPPRYSLFRKEGEGDANSPLFSLGYGSELSFPSLEELTSPKGI